MIYCASNYCNRTVADTPSVNGTATQTDHPPRHISERRGQMQLSRKMLHSGHSASCSGYCSCAILDAAIRHSFSSPLRFLSLHSVFICEFLPVMLRRARYCHSKSSIYPSVCQSVCLSICMSMTLSSGVPRILEWEGSRCRRLRGSETCGGGIPSPLRKCLRRGCAPPLNIFRIFLLKIPYFDAFWRIYFPNHTPMEGVLTP